MLPFVLSRLLCLSTAAVAAASLGAPAPSEPSTPVSMIGVGVTGRAFTDIYLTVDRNPLPQAFQQFSTSAWLEVEPRIAETSVGHVTLALDQLDMTQPGSGPRLSLREGYLAYQSAGWDLRAGKQILPWGKSDAINPTDFVTGKDFTFFNPDEEVRRSGSTSLFLAWTPTQGNAPVTFQLYWSPAFAPSRLLIANSVLPAGVNPTIATTLPGVSPENSEGAFRTLVTGSRWDASLTLYRGWNRMPQLGLVSVVTVPTPQATLNLSFSRITAVGGDLSFTLDPWIFRAEGAYVFTENSSVATTLIPPNHLYAVLGVERPLGSSFRAQLQGVLKAYPYWLSPASLMDADPIVGPIKVQIAQTNALILNYQDQVRPSMTARISYENTTKGWDAELFGMVNFIGADFLLRPKLAYHVTDAIRLTLGADVYVGDSDTPLGALRPYSAVFTEAKLSF